MTLSECIEQGKRDEEFAYAERAAILRNGKCPMCDSRAHSYPSKFAVLGELGHNWWCARCNHEFTE